MLDFLLQVPSVFSRLKEAMESQAQGDPAKLEVLEELADPESRATPLLVVPEAQVPPQKVSHRREPPPGMGKLNPGRCRSPGLGV